MSPTRSLQSLTKYELRKRLRTLSKQRDEARTEARGYRECALVGDLTFLAESRLPWETREQYAKDRDIAVEDVE